MARNTHKKMRRFLRAGGCGSWYDCGYGPGGGGGGVS